MQSTTYYISINPDTHNTEIVKVYSYNGGFQIDSAYSPFNGSFYKTQRGVDGWLKKHNAYSLDENMSNKQAAILYNQQNKSGGSWRWLYALIEKANG